jgi:hypothetical protein
VAASHDLDTAFSQLLAELDGQLKPDQWLTLARIFSTKHLPAGVRANFRSAAELLQWMYGNNLIGPTNVDNLKQWLAFPEINATNLVSMLQNYEQTNNVARYSDVAAQRVFALT